MSWGRGGNGKNKGGGKEGEIRLLSNEVGMCRTLKSKELLQGITS